MKRLIFCMVAAGLGYYYYTSQKKRPKAAKRREASYIEDEFEDDNESSNIVSLLYSIAEEKARLYGIVHRSITCNHCKISPVRGIRYKCCSCVDFDLCANCESLGIHNRLHSFIKITIPIPPLSNPRSLILKPFYPGTFLAEVAAPDVCELEQSTHFDEIEILGLYQQFLSLSTDDSKEGGITKQVFEYCLGSIAKSRNIILDRMFCFYDQNGDGIITFDEMVCGLSILSKGSLEDKIFYAFKGYDTNNDGFITKEELRTMLKAYFKLSMELVKDVVKVMEEGMLEGFDDESHKPVSASFPTPSHVNDPSPMTKLFDDDSLPSPVREQSSVLKFSLVHRKSETGDEGLAIIETVSQDAIEDLVSIVFADLQSLSTDGERLEAISFEHFRILAKNDINLISWFEALGHVF